MILCRADNRIVSDESFPSKVGCFPARSARRAKEQRSLRTGAGGVGGLVAISVDGDYYFPGYDNNGNVIGYWNEDGEIVAEYAYDAFGNTIYEDGDMAAVFPHRFSTKYYDAETDLYYYGYRYYSPSLGRWISRDPIEEKGGLNLVSFCENDSISRFDPLGKNIYLIEGTGTTGFLPIDSNHQDICVTVWNDDFSRQCRLACFSFVSTFKIRSFPAKTTWLGWFSPSPPVLDYVGVIREQESPNFKKLRLVAKKATTKWQDRAWLTIMRKTRVGLEDLYSIANHNCRKYTFLEFNDAPGSPWWYK